MLDKFYFKYIDIPEYESVIHQIRINFLPEISKIRDPGFSLLHNEGKILHNCNLFNSWLLKNNLKISDIGVHILEPQTVGLLHSDQLHDGIALNMDIANCSDTFTKLFKVSNSGKTIKTINGKLTYTMYNFDDTCKEITKFNLLKPVLFNIAKPHRVYNLKNTKRISISFRFDKLPINLI